MGAHVSRYLAPEFDGVARFSPWTPATLERAVVRAEHLLEAIRETDGSSEADQLSSFRVTRSQWGEVLTDFTQMVLPGQFLSVPLEFFPRFVSEGRGLVPPLACCTPPAPLGKRQIPLARAAMGILACVMLCDGAIPERLVLAWKLVDGLEPLRLPDVLSAGARPERKGKQESDVETTLRRAHVPATPSAAQSREDVFRLFSAEPVAIDVSASTVLHGEERSIGAVLRMLHELVLSLASAGMLKEAPQAGPHAIIVGVAADTSPRKEDEVLQMTNDQVQAMARGQFSAAAGAMAGWAATSTGALAKAAGVMRKRAHGITSTKGVRAVDAVQSVARAVAAMSRQPFAPPDEESAAEEVPDPENEQEAVERPRRWGKLGVFDLELSRHAEAVCESHPQLRVLLRWLRRAKEWEASPLKDDLGMSAAHDVSLPSLRDVGSAQAWSWRGMVWFFHLLAIGSTLVSPPRSWRPVLNPVRTRGWTDAKKEAEVEARAALTLSAMARALCREFLAATLAVALNDEQHRRQKAWREAKEASLRAQGGEEVVVVFTELPPAQLLANGIARDARRALSTQTALVNARVRATTVLDWAVTHPLPREVLDRCGTRLGPAGAISRRRSLVANNGRDVRGEAVGSTVSRDMSRARRRPSQLVSAMEELKLQQRQLEKRKEEEQARVAEALRQLVRVTFLERADLTRLQKELGARAQDGPWVTRWTFHAVMADVVTQSCIRKYDNVADAIAAEHGASGVGQRRASLRQNAERAELSKRVDEIARRGSQSIVVQPREPERVRQRKMSQFAFVAPSSALDRDEVENGGRGRRSSLSSDLGVSTPRSSVTGAPPPLSLAGVGALEMYERVARRLREVFARNHRDSLSYSLSAVVRTNSVGRGALPTEPATPPKQEEPAASPRRKRASIVERVLTRTMGGAHSSGSTSVNAPPATTRSGRPTPRRSSLVKNDPFREHGLRAAPRGQELLEVVEGVFRAFDPLGEGWVDHLEVVLGIGRLVPGTLEQRLKFLFQVYDVDGSGSLELFELIQVIVNGRSAALEAAAPPGGGRRGSYSGFEVGGISGASQAESLSFAGELASMLDEDGDGVITEEEFIRVLRREPVLLECMGDALTEQHYSSGRRFDLRLLQTIAMRYSHVPHSAVRRTRAKQRRRPSVDLSSLVVPSGLASEGDPSRPAVTLLDRCLSLSQFRRLLLEAFECPADALPLATRVFELFDRDKSGTVDVRELYSGMLRATRGSLHERAMFFFRLFDDDDSGTLTIEEIQSLLAYAQAKKMDISEEEARSVIRALDADNSGTVELNEWMRAVSQQPAILRSISRVFGRTGLFQVDEKQHPWDARGEVDWGHLEDSVKLAGPVAAPLKEKVVSRPAPSKVIPPPPRPAPVVIKSPVSPSPRRPVVLPKRFEAIHPPLEESPALRRFEAHRRWEEQLEEGPQMLMVSGGGASPLHDTVVARVEASPLRDTVVARVDRLLASPLVASRSLIAHKALVAHLPARPATPSEARVHQAEAEVRSAKARVERERRARTRSLRVDPEVRDEPRGSVPMLQLDQLVNTHHHETAREVGKWTEEELARSKDLLQGELRRMDRVFASALAPVLPPGAESTLAPAYGLRQWKTGQTAASDLPPAALQCYRENLLGKLRQRAEEGHGRTASVSLIDVAAIRTGVRRGESVDDIMHRVTQVSRWWKADNLDAGVQKGRLAQRRRLLADTRRMLHDEGPPVQRQSVRTEVDLALSKLLEEEVAPSAPMEMALTRSPIVNIRRLARTTGNLTARF
jgi:Ca2+-binding EF-hand superfamily protein